MESETINRAMESLERWELAAELVDQPLWVLFDTAGLPFR